MARKSLSKDQIALRKLRYGLWDRFVPWLGAGLLIVLSAIPLAVIGYWVHEVAGKTTNINAVISVSIAVNIAFAATIGIYEVRRRKQVTAIEELRGKLSAYQEAGLLTAGVATQPAGNAPVKKPASGKGR